MRAAVLSKPGTLEVRDVPDPEPGDGDVIVAVRAALTCGTDLKTWLRGHPKFPPPTRLGHECAGEVLAVGRSVRDVREGDAVMFAPTGPCGQCDWCERGEENLCETLFDDMVLGAYAEKVRVPARVVRSNLFAKPAGISWERAALLEPVACVFHGLRNFPARRDDRVVLLGGGGFTLLHLLVLRRKGVETVGVVTRRRPRAEAAKRLGASGVIEMDATEAVTAVREWTGGGGADLVVECTGQPSVWEAAPAMSRRGGDVVLFGGCPSGTRVSFDAGRLHYDQVRLHSPFHLDRASVRESFEFLSSTPRGLDDVLSGVLPLEGVGDALERMRRGEGIKYVIQP